MYRYCAGKLFIVISTMLLRLISDFIVLCVDDPVVCYAESVSLISAVANVTVGAGRVLGYPPPYFVDE